MLRIALLVTVAACGSSPPPAAPSPPAPDCASAVAAAGRFVAEPSEAERVKSVVALRCVEDHWPASATTCIAAAANLEAAHACIRETLTVAQHERLMTELAPPAAPVADKPPAEVTELPPDDSHAAPAGSQAAIASKLLGEGVKLYSRRQFADASMKFRDAVARVPEARHFWYLCLSLYQEGKFSEALTACNAGLKNDPPAATRERLERQVEKIQSEAKAQGVVVRP